MSVLRIPGSGKVYSSNVYLITGEWKALGDPNALIDVGADESLLAALEQASTGVGKRKVEKVVVTHSHSDHVALMPLVKSVFKPVVMAFSPHTPGVDHVLVDGEKILLGDRTYEVIHAPGHSDDSICLYEPKDGLLFTGDSPVVILSEGGTYDANFVEVLARLTTMHITTIYPGHGEPLRLDVAVTLRRSYDIARRGMKRTA